MIDLITIASVGNCGIAEHTEMLGAALPGDLSWRRNPDWLDPAMFWRDLSELQQWQGPQVVWLNYHAGLHSRWTFEEILRLRHVFPVLVTYHDTGVPNSEQCKSVRLATMVESTSNVVPRPPLQPATFIIHEPADDLPGAHYIRQGILPLLDYRANYDLDRWHARIGRRPLVGTVGFPFPWKNYDLLCQASAQAGWATLLLAPTATPADVARWQALNPATLVVPDFIPAETVVRDLARCDATAFLYNCHNTGTSGAIRMGVAARQPVLALASCRQFRDLEGDDLGARAIRWIHDGSVDGVAQALEQVPIGGRIDARVHRLAERDSWTSVADQYAEIIRKLVNQTQQAPVAAG